MVSGINASVSGLLAAAKRVEASASNIANQSSTRSIVDGEPSDKPYVPKTVDQVSLSTGGTQAVLRDIREPSVKRYEPSNADAGEDGTVSVPNVDTATEMVKMNIASYDYKANLKAIKIQDDIQQNLLDILS